MSPKTTEGTLYVTLLVQTLIDLVGTQWFEPLIQPETFCAFAIPDETEGSHLSQHAIFKLLKRFSSTERHHWVFRRFFFEFFVLKN